MKKPEEDSRAVLLVPQDSIFLQNAHYFFGQTDGTYAWPAGTVGDLLKQAKLEIEQLRAALPTTPDIRSQCSATEARGG